MSSVRLPGKGLKNLDRQPLLAHLADSLKSVKAIDEVVLATTLEPCDDPLEEWATDYGLGLFRGSKDDVLGRFYMLAKSFEATIIVRANGDSPLIDPHLVEQSIEQLIHHQLDFVTGKAKYTHLPPGLSPEVLTFEALERLHGKAKSSADREHVTSYLFSHPSEFRWQPLLHQSTQAPPIPLTVDSPEDLDRVKMIHERLPEAHTEALLRALKGMEEALPSIQLAERSLNAKEAAYCIAEIGLNHNGDVDLAKQLFHAAAESGADAVKLQTFRAEELMLTSDSRLEAMRRLELPEKTLIELREYAASLDIDFLSTPFDEQSVDLLWELQVPAFKIASCDLNNHPLLTYAAHKGLPLLLSTGYSSWQEIDRSYRLLQSLEASFALLHCSSAYPSELSDMNLQTLKAFSRAFHVPVGLSDHSLDIDLVPVMARAMGAVVFEKHFTVDQNLPGFDHAISATAEMFATMVKKIRDTESALGEIRKEAFSKELLKKEKARRSLYWRQDLSAGELVTRDMIKIARPEKGLSPEEISQFLNKKLTKDVKKESAASLEDVGLSPQ